MNSKTSAPKISLVIEAHRIGEGLDVGQVSRASGYPVDDIESMEAGEMEPPDLFLAMFSRICNMSFTNLKAIRDEEE